MDAAELFAEIITQGKAAAAPYSKFLTFRSLRAAGLLHEAGVVGSVLCDECNHTHDAAVIFDNGQYGFFCPDLGFISRRRIEVAAVRANIPAFVAQLAEVLECKRRKSTPIAGNTWRVGNVPGPTADVSVYFQPRLVDAADLHVFKDALAREVRPEHSIVFTAAGTLEAPPLKTVLLEDAMTFDVAAGQFDMELDLRAIAGVPKAMTGGRPGVHKPRLMGLLQEREDRGDAKEGRNAEAQAVLSEYQKTFAQEMPPALSLVKTYVTEFRRG